MSKNIFAVKLEMLEQELVEFERWAKDNFNSLPHAVQMVLARGHRATEERIVELKLMGFIKRGE